MFRPRCESGNARTYRREWSGAVSRHRARTVAPTWISHIDDAEPAHHGSFSRRRTNLEQSADRKLAIRRRAQKVITPARLSSCPNDFVRVRLWKPRILSFSQFLQTEPISWTS